MISVNARELRTVHAAETQSIGRSSYENPKLKKKEWKEEKVPTVICIRKSYTRVATEGPLARHPLYELSL